MIDRSHIKQEMPRGMGKMVAEKIGVTPKSVSNYLTGKTNSNKIEMAILQSISDFKKERRKLIKEVYDSE